MTPTEMLRSVADWPRELKAELLGGLIDQLSMPPGQDKTPEEWAATLLRRKQEMDAGVVQEMTIEQLATALASRRA